MTTNFFIFFIILTGSIVSAQCKIQSTKRPDGTTVHYFTPTPVAKADSQEVGISLYYTEELQLYTLAIFVLHKKTIPVKNTSNLLIQTSNAYSLILEPHTHDLINMNGQEVSCSIYYLNQDDIDKLIKGSLKTISFTSNSKIMGYSVTLNSSIIQQEYSCINQQYGNKK